MPPTRGRMWSRFSTLTMPLFLSEICWLAIGFLGLFLLFIFCLNGLNVLSSYANKWFVSAVGDRDASLAFSYGVLWVAVFGVLTVVSVFKSFTEDRLRLRWRAWLTDHLIRPYLRGRAHYRLNAPSDVDNPDQRITQDLK